MDRGTTRGRRQLLRHQGGGSRLGERGRSDELVRIGERVIAQVRTMGIASQLVHSTGESGPLFEIADDEMEIGIGIHGEPGRRRTKLVPANEIVDILVDAVVPDLPFESGDEVALMINGLGGTPISELYLLYGIAHNKLTEKGINVFRSYVNEYVPRSEMAGASLTLLKVDDELKDLLLAPAEISNRVFLRSRGREGPASRPCEGDPIGQSSVPQRERPCFGQRLSG